MQALSAFALSLALLAGPAAAQGTAPKLETEEQKTLYALGLAMSGNLGPFALSPADLALVQAGLADGVLKKTPAVILDEYQPKIRDLMTARSAKLAEAEKAAGQAYLVKAAAKKGAVKLPSGVITEVMTPGTGAQPDAADTVKVHYVGTLTDGTEFDSSVKRGEPATFALNGVVACWTQGVATMKVGGKTRLVCPSDTAYGDRGRPPQIPGGATLVFEVELLDVIKK